MKLKRRMSRDDVKDLDITSFMNLMIVLVPVLLISMVFAHTTVLDLTLPDLAASPESAREAQEQQLELVIYPDSMDLNFPAGTRLKRIEKQDGDYDYQFLSTVLQEVKRTLREKGIEKKDILILSQPDTDYQTIVSIMDTVRSFQAVVAADVVNAELFPDISLGDAPVVDGDVTGVDVTGVQAEDELAANGGAL